MFVPCPHCQFLIAQHPQQRTLPPACPRCGRPLEAAPGTDQGTPDVDADSASRLEQAPPATVASDAVSDTGLVSGADDTDTDAGSGIASPAAAATEIPAVRRPARPHAGGIDLARLQRWQWPAIGALALLLPLQMLLADRGRLAADPAWRPTLEAICGVLRCTLPAWHEPRAFSMLDRKVRPAGDHAPGVLRVDASFRNDARWAQAWPALQLALSDADGRTLGSQVFLPEQYLGAAPTELLAPGQSTQVTFLVREPGPGTVAFSFDFR